MKMPSTSGTGHKFAQVPRAEISRSQFDRSCGYKTTFDAGYLVPFYVDEVLPGDTFNVRLTAFARLATPLRPIMDNMYLETFFFFVPTRLLWTNWKRFNGEQPTPESTTDFVIPALTLANTSIPEGSVADYMGLPLNLDFTAYTGRINSLPFRAYRLIWNEWFRDQNLQDSVTVPLDDGPDSNAEVGAMSNPLRRGKRHDYFTSALPWPQKGDSVSLPLGTVAEVGIPSGGTGTTLSIRHRGTGNAIAMDASGPNLLTGGTVGGAQMLTADLQDATAATINELRQAFQVQKLLERDARGGTRYTEIVRAHFGVTSPDARLQRPEYLGGGSTPVNISPVANTSGTATENQGDLAGIGTASVSGHGFVKSFTEHGYVLGMMSVRADLTYQQGIERFWSRETRYDFFWPALQHIGEQAVLNREIFVSNSSVDEDVFGYQERFGEYRYKPSLITGRFRSAAAAPLDMWHLSQEFGSLPELNSTFIEDNPPVDRVIAVPSEPHFLFDSFIKAKCARPMPVYGVPGFIDHF